MIQYKVHIEVEDTPVRGNYMCTDSPEQDTMDEDDVLLRLSQGDEKAWFRIVVTASLNDFKYMTSMGCCSFSEDDSIDDEDIQDYAREHGLYEDAKEGLHEVLKDTLHRVNQALETMSTLL